MEWVEILKSYQDAGISVLAYLVEPSGTHQINETALPFPVQITSKLTCGNASVILYLKREENDSVQEDNSEQLSLF